MSYSKTCSCTNSFSYIFTYRLHIHLQLQLRVLLYHYSCHCCVETAAAEPTDGIFIQARPNQAHTMMRANRKRGCFTAVVALFSTVAVAAILNISIWRLGSTWNERGHEGGGPPIQPERVAVCFFGLTRSLRWTLPSIENRLLRVLRDSGIVVDIFVHTYHLVEVGYDDDGHAWYYL